MRAGSIFKQREPNCKKKKLHMNLTSRNMKILTKTLYESIYLEIT